MALFVLRLMALFGLPWNYFLWWFFIRPHKNLMFNVDEFFYIMIYSVVGTLTNIVLAIIIGVLCL